MAKPAKKLIAADASPLIGLATADAFDLLRQLFGTVTITQLVKDEVLAGGILPGARELRAAMREGWIRVAPAPLATWRLTGLDSGEASTIALALQHDGPRLVLMDDTVGREQAVANGLEVTSLAGLLLAARRAQLIEAVEPLLARLARRGFIVSDEALREATEAPLTTA